MKNKEMRQIQEGKAKIYANLENVPSKKMDVFYNPAMKLNRDLSVLLLNSVENKKIRIADILAGTGVRSIRFFFEVDKNKIGEIAINDYSKKAADLIKKNLKLNMIKSKKVKVYSKDANIFLLESRGFDYIDIDPFGFPGRFLDAAALRISRNGILAVTATDTAALAGSSEKACIRKYWAKPLKNEFMHETGLRILIRRIQLIGAQYEKAFFPILSYYKDHYMRVFLRCEKGKKKVDSMIKKHSWTSYCRKCLWRNVGYFEDCKNCSSKTEIAGPLWTGKIADKKMINLLLKNSEPENMPFLRKIRQEAKIEEPYFYDIHKLAQKYKKGSIPKNEEIIKEIRKRGFKAEQTHFRNEGIKSSIKIAQIAEIIKRFK